METFSLFFAPKDGNSCIICAWRFITKLHKLVWLRSLVCHLFYVARRKFCKSRKFGFWSFPDVITIWRIQLYSWFVSKPFTYEELAPPNIDKCCDLQSRKIFWPLLRFLNQVSGSYFFKIFDLWLVKLFCSAFVKSECKRDNLQTKSSFFQVFPSWKDINILWNRT